MSTDLVLSTTFPGGFVDYRGKSAPRARICDAASNYDTVATARMAAESGGIDTLKQRPAPPPGGAWLTM